jgi:hypothetical protein
MELMMKMPVTVDDRAINIIPMGDDDSVGRGGWSQDAIFQIIKMSFKQTYKKLKTPEELERKRMKSKQMQKEKLENE